MHVCQNGRMLCYRTKEILRLCLYHPILTAQHSRDDHAGDVIADGVEHFAGASTSAPIMVIIGKVSVNHGNNRPHDSLFYSKAILMLCFMLDFLSWPLV